MPRAALTGPTPVMQARAGKPRRKGSSSCSGRPVCAASSACRAGSGPQGLFRQGGQQFAGGGGTDQQHGAYSLQ